MQISSLQIEETAIIIDSSILHKKFTDLPPLIERRPMKTLPLSLAILAVLFNFEAPSYAETVFIGSSPPTGSDGDPISAKATFSLTTYDFDGAGANLAEDAVKIVLENTAVDTNHRGNLLTGIFFSVEGNVGSLPTNSSGFNGVAPIVRTVDGPDLGTADDILTNVDVAPAENQTATDGGFMLSNGPFGNANNQSYASFEYGISTVGFGLNGFNGSDLNAGDGQDDYGIASASAGLTESSVKLRPISMGSVTFWIARPALWTSSSQVYNVRFVYGSRPDNYQTGHSVPLPSSLALLGSGFASFAGVWAVRRKRQSAKLDQQSPSKV